MYPGSPLITNRSLLCGTRPNISKKELKAKNYRA